MQSLDKALGFKGFMCISVHKVLEFRVLFTFLHVKVLGFAEFHMKNVAQKLELSTPQMDMLCPSTMEYVLFVVAHTQFAQEATMVKTVVGRDISFEHEA